MPFQSEKQRRYLHANHPEIAKRWERDYGEGGIAALNAQLNQLPEYYLPAADGGRIRFDKGADLRSMRARQGHKAPTTTGGNGGGGGPPVILNPPPSGPSLAEIEAQKKAAQKKAMEEAQLQARERAMTQRAGTKKKVRHLEGLKTYGPYSTSAPIGVRHFGDKTLKTINDSSNIALDETTGQYVNLITGELLGFADPSSPQVLAQKESGIKPTQIAELKTEKILRTKWANTPIQWDEIKAGSVVGSQKVFDRLKADPTINTWGDLYRAGLSGKIETIGGAQIMTQNPEGLATLGKEMPYGMGLKKDWSMGDLEVEDLYERIPGAGVSKYHVNVPLIGEEKTRGTFGLTGRSKGDFLQKDVEEKLRAKGWLAEGGVARKNYFHGGILGINESEEIIDDDGNDIELTAYNAAFDDPKDLSTGVKTLFQVKDGGRIGFRKGTSGAPGGGDPGMYSAPSSTGGNGGGGDDQEEDVAEMMRKMALQDIIERGPGSDVEKYDTDLVGMTPNEKYNARRNAIKAKYTGISYKRVQGLTTNYNTEKARLEKKMNNFFLKTFGLAFAGFMPTPSSFVGIDWKNKKLSGVLGDAMTLDKLKKQQIKDLTDMKDSLLVDVDINNPNEMKNLDDTAFPDIMKKLKELTKPRDEDEGREGSEYVPTIQLLEEQMQGVLDPKDWMAEIRARQAKREIVQPDWQLTAAEKELKYNPIVGESVTDITMQANSGGLANLFRVKNQ